MSLVPLRAAIVALIFSGVVSGETLAELLEALGRTASTCSATAPGLSADEVLEQRGRRGFLEIGKGSADAPRLLDIKLQNEFRNHRVVSLYGLTELGAASVLHEIRKVSEFDGRALTDPVEARHALSAGMEGDEDRTRKILLENFEQQQLEGAVTDFGQLLLLFRTKGQKDYAFTARGRLGLSYRQTSGTHGLTTFRERSTEREATSGEIEFSGEYLLPMRITLATSRRLTKKDVVRTEASVEYAASRYGLVPSKIVHRQFLNKDLLVENVFTHTNWQHEAPEMIP